MAQRDTGKADARGVAMRAGLADAERGRAFAVVALEHGHFRAERFDLAQQGHQF